jgi:glycogen synthase
MQKVLRIVTRLNRGGPLRQLAALVPRLPRHGYDGPVVFGSQVAPGERDGREELLRVGARLVALPSLARGLAPAMDARAFQDLLQLAKDEHPDLVHTHMGKAGALGRLVARSLGIPTVHTFHGHHFDAPGAGGRAAVAAERALAPLTTRAVALTPRQRRDLVEVHRVFPDEKVAVIPPGLDLEEFRRRAHERAPAAPWSEDGLPWFAWVGRLVHVKDPLLLVEALEHARRPWRVVLVGGGPYEKRVVRRVKRRGVGGRLLLAGHADEPAGWVQGSSGVVLSSRSEGAPLAILEAFALGKPVVVPTVGGLPDLVEHGMTGLWVPPGDARALAAALDRLADDAALRERLGRAAAFAAAGYGAEALAAGTASLYDGVLGRVGAA